MEEEIQQEAKSASLGVQDLLLMFQIIQVVTQRGAFRADEMTNVGGLHDRLKAFLVSAGVISTTTSNAEPAGADTQDSKE